MLFFREVICGGDDAAGGGCGAPLGVWKMTEHLFKQQDAQNKSVRTYFLEHSLKDGGVPEGEAFETFAEFRPCFYCRRA